jgi:VCBS repeat-containing protein
VLACRIRPNRLNYFERIVPVRRFGAPPMEVIMAARMVRRFVPLSIVLLALAFPLGATVLTVEGPQDSLEGAPTINHCTLRKAIINSNTDTAAYPQCASGSGIDTIDFLSAFTITTTIPRADQADGETNGDYNITQSVIIEGGGTIVDGAALDRLFHISGNTTVVTIRNLWIRNGRGVEGGGGILVDGATVNLENVTISGCVASAEDGGGIKVINGGTLNMTNCTIHGNSTVVHGGAVAIDDGLASATITSCTITGNSGGFSNTAGGLHNTGTCTLRNTIVAGNSGTDIPNLNGIYTSNGYNIIGELGTLTPGNPQITATTGDQFDVNVADLHLGPLQNNGGLVPTRELQTGSIAIDKGHSSGSTTDARGLTRPCDLASVTNASGGDGGDVGAFEVQGTCAAVNTNPDAVDDSVTISEDSGANPISVLANDTDAEGDTLSVTGVTQGAHGSVANNGTSVSYTPAPNFFGSDSFTYSISDGNGGSDTATVNVTVLNVNDPPVAVGESYTINQDTVLSVSAPGVLGNDSDIDGDALTAVLVSGPAHGTLSLAANGSFSYAPAAHYAGSDSFTYHAFDGLANSNTVTVSITILDTEPPAINASLGTSVLWPPDHDLVNVGFVFTATDNSPGAISTTLAVFSNEDDVTRAGGDQSPDAKSIASGTLRLRAERDANGNGRVYLIRMSATDASANTSRTCIAAVVPKSQSAEDAAGVNAMALAAISACNATGTPPAGYFVVGDGPVVGPKQ